MSTNTAISIWDDARALPLIRGWLKAKARLTDEEAEQEVSDRLMIIVRDAASGSFQEWLNAAVLWQAQGELQLG